MKINELRIYNVLKNRNSKFIPYIEQAAFDAEKYLGNIKNLFHNYTDHSIEHSYRVAEHMYDLMHSIEKFDSMGKVYNAGDFVRKKGRSRGEITRINDLELALALYAALFHDVGMVVSGSEKRAIISGESKPIPELDFERVKSNLASGDSDEAIQIIIRKCHGERSKNYINTELANKGYFKIPGHNQNFSHHIADLCWAHQVSLEQLSEKFKSVVRKGIQTVGEYEVNLSYISILLRLGDLLDLDADRAPEDIYSLLRLDTDDGSKHHWASNFSILNTKKIRACDGEEACAICPYDECTNVKRQVVFESHLDIGEDVDISKIKRSIMEYCGYVEKELNESVLFLRKMNFQNRYQLKIVADVAYESDDGITPNHRSLVDYKTIVKLLLGEKIYGEKRVGLREIIQNSIDACKYRLEIYPNSFDYQPTIKIILDKASRTVSIEDNGIGMSRNVVEQYFLQIGKSLYSSEWYKGAKHQFKNAGYYGIGFFAAFMLSKNVTVFTKKFDSSAVRVDISSLSEYSTIDTNFEPEFPSGTKIILDYDSFCMLFPTPDDVRYYIEINFLKNLGNNKNADVYVGTSVTDLIKCDLTSTAEHIPIREDNHTAYDLSKYFKDVECTILANPSAPIRWYIYDGRVFKLCTHRELNDYSDIIYLRIQLTDSSLVYLVVPPEFSRTPYGYSGVDRQRLFSTRNECIFNTYTISDFCRDNDITSFTFPNVAYVGKYKILAIDKCLYYLKTGVEFNDSMPDPTAILVGKQYIDRIYIRNVLIPNFHLAIPYLLAGYNDTMMPEIKKIAININHDKILPNIDRMDVPYEANQLFSYAMGQALLKWNQELILEGGSDAKRIIEKYYPSRSAFV